MKQEFKVPEGTTKVTIEQVGNQIITTFGTEPKFKKGDFVYSENSYDPKLRWIGIFKEDNQKECYFDYSTMLCIHSNDLIFDSYALKQNLRLATEAEKQTLLDAMHAEGKDWDAEKCEVVDYVEKVKKGQCLYQIFPDDHTEMFKFYQFESVVNANYRNDEFKTKELAQTACDKLNETLKSLKHY